MIIAGLLHTTLSSDHTRRGEHKTAIKKILKHAAIYCKGSVNYSPYLMTFERLKNLLNQNPFFLIQVLSIKLEDVMNLIH